MTAVAWSLPQSSAVLGQAPRTPDTLPSWFTEIDVDNTSDIDTNADAKVTRAEVQAYVALGFRDFDIDDDGRATREEVQLRRCDYARPGQHHPDCNGDGVIDDEEFIAFETSRMMTALDADKSGKITLQEFLTLAGPPTDLPGQPTYEWRREQVTQRFNEIDSDRNGVIDANEIRA